MTTPTREQVAFTAHLTHWDKSYPIRFDDFSAGYNAARSDLEATIAEQTKQIEEMAEAIKKAADQIRVCDYTPARSTLLTALAAFKDWCDLLPDEQYFQPQLLPRKRTS